VLITAAAEPRRRCQQRPSSLRFISPRRVHLVRGEGRDLSGQYGEGRGGGGGGGGAIAIHLPSGGLRPRPLPPSQVALSVACIARGAEANRTVLGEVPPAPRGAPPSPPRTKWTRRVPHPVLIGHAVSLTPY